jgi:hypothetical protein
MISTDWLNALDNAARYYREALKHVIEECCNDKPRIEHIREAAERGISAADHEFRGLER